MKHLYVVLVFLLFTFSYNSALAQSDNCSAATVLSVTANCSSPTAGSTAGFTQNIAGCVGNADDDGWYQFVATATSHQINVVPSAGYDPVVQLFSGACATLATISCMDATFTGQTETINATGLTIGATYRIRVYHYGAGSGSNTFTICVTNPPPAPANDLCSGAINLLVNTVCSNTAGTTVGATQSLLGCAGTADDDVWYSFTAVNTTATITVDPSVTMDAVLQLYSGTCASPTSIQCMDNGFTDGNEVINAVGLTPGSTYFIRVYDYYSGGGGTFNICVTGPSASAIPTNDEPCNAIALPNPNSSCNFLQFSTVGATASMGAPTPASCVGGSAPQQGGFAAGTKDVWFSVVIPANGQITITTQPGYGINDGVMALYSGACGALTQVACSDDHNYPGSANDLKPYINATGLTPGATYYIRYWGYGTSAGNFGLCVSSASNDFCASSLYICDLNGYSASTSAAYTPDRPCNMYGNNEDTIIGANQPDGVNTGGIFGQAGPWGTGAPLFDVNINNNSWIKFTASNTTAILNVAIGNCWVGNYPSGGIQMQIFASNGSCCNFVPVSDFKENSTGFTITANNLTIGNDYYLMVDGYAGDICSYTISANAGVQFPNITTTKPSLCFGDSTVLVGPVGASSYEWLPSGETTPNITVAPSTTTTYTLIVSGVCGAKQTLTQTIVVNPLPTVQINSSNPISVCNGSSVNLTASGASTYVWNTGATSTTIAVQPTVDSTFTVIGTTAAGCKDTTAALVQVLTKPTATISALNGDSVCIGNSTTLSASGGGTYLWDNSSTLDSLVVSPTVNTTYSVIVDVAGCKDTASIPITVNSLPIIGFSGDSVVCLGETTTIFASGGNSYNWNNGVANDSIVITPLADSTYSVTVTDAKNCVNNASINVQVNNLPIPIISGSSLICNGSSTTLTASGGTSYSWNNGASTPSISVSPAADSTYLVTVTDGNNCSDTTSTTVQVVSNPSGVITSSNGTNFLCAGNSFTLTVSGGGTYIWNTGSTLDSLVVSPSADSTYSVIVDVGGCKDTAYFAVTVNSLPTVSFSGNNTICNGQTTTLTASGGTSYSWNTGSTNDSIVVSPTADSTYSVSVTDANSCSNTGNITVTVNPLPIPSISGTSMICSGTSTTLTASGGTSYSWNNGASTPTITVSPAADSTYLVTVTDGNNCSDTTSTTVQVVSNPSGVITSSNGTNFLCSGNSFTLTATGGGTYLWNTGSTLDSLVVSPAADSTYDVIVDVGGCKDTVYFAVTVNSLPTVVITGNATICNGQTTTLTASGGTSYLWNNSSTNDSIVVSPTSTTTYNVTVTDANSCSNTSSQVVTVNALPIVAISGASSVCNGQSTILTASGGSTYVWSNAQTTPTVNVSPTVNSTNYQVVATGSNGCKDSTQHVVNVIPKPVAAISGNSSVCFGNVLALTASGGTSYLWDTGDTIANINVAPTDTITYTVIVSANGCSDTTNTTVNVIPLPTINAYSDTTIILGQSAVISASSATPFTWSPNEAISCTNCPSPTVNPTETTTYCVATTKNGCPNTSCVTVTVDNICGDLFVPNAFSPNGDGSNDCVMVYSNCLQEVLFRIYSRWGVMLFESDKIDGCWDGTYNGSEMNTGVYVFTVKAKLINGDDAELKGNVTLFR
ncbi:MAG: gliding motility-associated C-terminal domain-containing protein [Flavobacteriales bacterium]|nr:gliding motility-associated C-terminal domain-containing protein [Flavobacteriales bacterium]